MDASFLAGSEWGSTSLSAVGGVWSVIIALAVAIVGAHRDQLPPPAGLRDSMDAGANAAVLPVLSVASLVGFGAVVAALAGFRPGARLGARHRGRPAGFACGRHQCARRATGSASGGLTIALDALGGDLYADRARAGIDPA